ncbi:MAG TPA: hypothetical protein VHE99_11275 [Gammaproteobacteria bacterium]|nr:hypothetical protein [Gammaproteobacteria bacterium]
MKPSLKKTGHDICPVKVLLVEGNESKQLEQLRVLKDLGCQVDIASSGLLALDMYDAGYDVIIAGNDLKNVNSVQLTQIIHTHRPNSNVILITTTSFTDIINQVNLARNNNASFH